MSSSDGERRALAVAAAMRNRRQICATWTAGLMCRSGRTCRASNALALRELRRAPGAAARRGATRL